jgi:hypothetical protein
MKQQSVYNKYPDLLKVDDDPELSKLIDDLDKLCRQHQPPEDLVNLSIAQSLRAREAESYAVPLPKPQTLRYLTRTRPERKPFRRLLNLLVILLGLAMVVGGVAVLFTKASGVGPANSFSVAEPGCAGSGAPVPSSENARTIRVGCTTLYLPLVQADNDRITIEYVLSNSNYPLTDYMPFNTRLFDSQGNELKRLGGISSGQVNIFGGDAAYTKMEKAAGNPVSSPMPYGATAGEEWFDASTLSGTNSGSPVNLRLEIEAFSVQANSRNIPVKGGGSGVSKPYSPASSLIEGPFNFTLSVPYQNSALVSNLNLTDTVSGQTVTLEKVVRRPDYTRLYLRGINGPLDFDLNAAGLYMSITGDQVNYYNNSDQIFTSQDGGTIVQIDNSLQDRKGDWRLTLHPNLTNQKLYNSPNQTQNIASGPWFFQFKLTE